MGGGPGQQQLVNELVGTGNPEIAVALAPPYDVAHFDQVPAFLAAYGYQPNSLAAIVATLFGANSTGRLPVTAPTADNPAQPLYRWGWRISYH